MQVSLHGRMVMVTVPMVAKWPRSLERKDLTGGKNYAYVWSVLGILRQRDRPVDTVLRCLV